MVPRLSVLAAAVLALSAPVAAEVVQTSDHGFTTRDSVVVKGSLYDAWLALVAPARWWNKSHTWSGDAANLYISAQANGCFCELLPAPEGAPEEVRRGSVMHMAVIMVDPGKVLRMRGGLGPLQSEPADGVLTVTLSSVEGGTRIVWEYVVGGPMRYEIPQISKAVDGVMSDQLRRLARLLGPVITEEKPGQESERETGASAETDQSPAARSEAKAAPRPGVDEAFEDLAGAD